MRAFAPTRIARAVGARLLDLRSHVALNPIAMRAIRGADDHQVADDVVHLRAALDWLARAQDATPDDGFARGFSLIWNPYFRARGWQASYPETTGYIIPTLYAAAQVLNEPVWAERARRAARWEVAVQLENGAVQGGVIGQRRSPAVFNTGQVIFGWLAALEETRDAEVEAALRRACEFLVSVEHEGDWVQGNSQFARKDATAYNARAAWALAEAGAALGEHTYVDAAERILLKTARQQHPNGWFPACCLNDPQRPLLHTIAYTVRGLLEGGRVLHNEELSAAGMKAARALMSAVRPDGWMAGRFDAEWRGAADWSCLTGEAQMANNWMRLAEITGDSAWRAPVPVVLRYLKARQNRVTAVAGLRGGIAGSSPLGGEYGRYEILNWATKYFADALMRSMAEDITTGAPVTRLA